VGLDADPRKVDALRAGESYIEDVSPESLAKVAHQPLWCVQRIEHALNTGARPFEAPRS
jgi:hypothetical protein